MDKYGWCLTPPQVLALVGGCCWIYNDLISVWLSSFSSDHVCFTVMEAEVLEVVEDDEPVAVVEEGPGCKYYTDVKKGTDVEEGAEAQPQVCTNSTSALIESLNNQSVPINNILTILEVVSMYSNLYECIWHQLLTACCLHALCYRHKCEI